jgi:multiple sugar transport system permease protein
MKVKKAGMLRQHEYPSVLMRVALLILIIAVFLWSLVVVGRSWLGRGHGKSQVTLHVMFWGSPNEVRDVRLTIDQFCHANPNIRVVAIPVSGPYYTKLDSMLAAGDPPDVMYVSASRVTTLVHEGVLADLTPYLQARRRSGHMKWFHQYFPKVLSAFRYTHGGKIAYYGLPKDFSTMVMFVNLRLFRQAGLAVPYGGWTWHDYERDVQIMARRCQTGRSRVFGGALITTSRLLRNIVWTFGGRFFLGPHSDKLAFMQPPALEALHMIRRVRFKIGSVYNHIGVGFTQRAIRAFLAGRVGVLGPWGRWFVPLCRAEPDLNFDVVPLPHAPGIASTSLISTVAWSMSARCAHPRAAFKLLTFLAGPAGQTITTREGLSVPSLESIARSSAFLDPNLPPRNARLFLDEVQTGRIAPGIREDRTFNHLLRDTIGQSINLDGMTPKEAATRMSHRWSAVLDSPLRRGQFSAMPWHELIASGFVLIGLGVLVLVLWILRQRWGRESILGMVFISPWLVGFIGLTVFPMILSLFLSLTRWRPIASLSTARFVGLANYQQILFHDPHFLDSLKITVLYAVLALVSGQILALLLALLIHRPIRGTNVFRFITLMPLAVSSVCLGSLWLTMFNDHHGLINELLRPPLSLLGLRPPNWFGSDAQFWAVPAYVLMSLWTVGAAVIIYLAGLSRISVSLYEAALLDGAGMWRRLYSITLPMLSPIIFFNVVVSLIASLQLFSQAQVMTNGRPADTSLFYVLYIFQQGFEYFHFGYAAALSWLLFVFILVLTVAVFRLARRYVSYEGAWI